MLAAPDLRDTILAAWGTNNRVTVFLVDHLPSPLLAMLALAYRVAEGISGMDVSKTLGPLWLATATDARRPQLQTEKGEF